jgi:predicted DNA-binding protein with PD1-like motif
MRCVKNGPYYQLRLMPGEEVMAELAAFVRRRHLKSGFLFGLGAAEDVVLGCFQPGSRTYRKRTFKGDLEVAALVGNVAWAGKDPVCHVHAVISNSRLATFAGHLFSARVTVTCEVSILPGQRKLVRRLESETGLRLLQLPASRP